VVRKAIELYKTYDKNAMKTAVLENKNDRIRVSALGCFISESYFAICLKQFTFEN
jgi:hypothetical protein